MRSRQITSRQLRKSQDTAVAVTALAVQAGMVRRMLREPLLHFLLAGAVIFGLWALLHPASPGADGRIIVTAAEVQRLRVQATRQWGREPEPQALAALVEADIREQVMYREALAAGLDRDDVVVRRRLVQKLDSLAQDQLREPDEAALRAHWQTHHADQQTAAALNLQQYFFSRALRGAKAPDDARKALLSLEQGRDAVAGDPFLLPATTTGQTQAALARDYGNAFARQAFALPIGRWQGPLESSLGVHLVRIDARTASIASTFETMREQVRQDYARLALQAAQEAAYRQMRARYRIDIAPDALPAAAAAQAPQ